MSLLPLATATWGAEEYDVLRSVIDSGNFTMGRRVQEFEGKFAQYVGSKYCVMVNSGSSANLLAVAALFYHSKKILKPGDEVIVPAVSWSTTYFPLQQYGLKVKFVDIDRDTLNLDLEQLKDAISPETRAIFAVNLLGNPIDYEKLNEIIMGYDIVLLEDNCESMGALFQGQQAGTFGLIGTFSSFFSHHISTMEGGMAVTNDEELYHIMLALRAHGWTRNLPAKNLIEEQNKNSFYSSFRFVLPGYNLRPLEMSGALGLAQLKKLPQFIEGRRKNAACFQKLFSHIQGLSIQQETGESSWFGFAFLLNSQGRRDRLVEVFTEKGIDCRPIVAGNFANNPAVRYFDYTVHNTLANADVVNDCGLFIGNHHYDVSDALHVVKKAVQEVLE